MKNKHINTPDLIGKYLNRYLFSDVLPVGKIIAIKTKTIVIVQRIVQSENKQKMNFQVGGFSAHCDNNYSQHYDYKTTTEIFEIRLSKQYLKTVRIDDKPLYFYDFNF